MKKLAAFAVMANILFLSGLLIRELCDRVQAASQPSGSGAGDLNGDGSLDVADAIYLLVHLFRGGPAPVACAESGDLADRVQALELQLSQLGSDLRGDFSGLSERVDRLQERSALTAEQSSMLSYMSLVDVEDGNGGTRKTIQYAGVNLQLVNGLGATNGDPEMPYNNAGTPRVNGLGNLIIGYQELRPDPAAIQDRTGSHNLIVGTQHNYSSYGGLVVGYENTISGEYSVVSAGAHCVASGNTAAVSGGRKNIASGEYSSVSGGHQNEASNRAASVCGGRFNIASGQYSTVAGGGTDETASQLRNIARSDFSFVAGGRNNLATQTRASVFGGQSNEASAFQATILGGTNNRAAGDNSTVTGGDHNTATGENSSVSGGQNRSVSGKMDWRAGDLFQDQ